MSNRLKEVFTNQEILYKGKISFKDKKAYDEFIGALRSVQEEGKTIKVDGITCIEASAQNGNSLYPIFEQKKISDAMISLPKEKVTFHVDTETGTKEINFSRFYTKGSTVLETEQDEIVYLKITIEPETGRSRIIYRAQPERAKSIAEIIDYYGIVVAYFNKLFKQPIETMKEDVSIEEWDSIRSMQNYFEKAVKLYKKLYFLEQQLKITVEPSKLQQDEDESWMNTEELYIILNKKMPIRLNVKSMEIKSKDLKISEQTKNIKVGTALEVAYIKKKIFYLWGNIVELYTSNLLMNAIVKEFAELEDGTTKISYGEEDSRPMFVVYKGFITEMEVENEMKDIMKNREMYVNAKRLGEYLTEER